MTFQNLAYHADGEPFAGRLFTPAQAPRGGVLVCHDGAGPGAHAWTRAERLAAAGWLAYAPDLLGGPFERAEAHVAALQALAVDAARLRRRTGAALQALRRAGGADLPLAAIGFCFGGAAALELARSGAELACVVSFHGRLATTQAAGPGAVRARVLACAGAADPFVPAEERAAFEAEMTAAGADWRLLVLGGALHGFTHPELAAGARPGMAYHPAADRRAWAAMEQALAEALEG